MRASTRPSALRVDRRAIRSACWILALLASASCAVRGPVPVEQEPRHRRAFENADLRVLDVRIPAGESTLEHQHAHDLLSVCISSSEVRVRMRGSDWGAAGPRRVIGDASLSEYTGKPAAHAVQNVGTEHFRLIAVENLGTEWSAPGEASDPALPILQDSRAFRALAIELTADARRSQRRHAVPVVIVRTHGAVTVEMPDAPPQELDFDKPWAVIPADVQFLLDARDGAARVVEIQVR